MKLSSHIFRDVCIDLETISFVQVSFLFFFLVNIPWRIAPVCSFDSSRKLCAFR